MLILGIETSGQRASVALMRDDALLGERVLESARQRHAQTLVAEIDALFREHGLRVRDCEGVAVSVGPGSFTGLRIGVVCAKTLAYATGCRLAGVDTLQAIAENSPDDVTEPFVVSDAQRGQWYVCQYRRSGGSFVARGQIEIVDRDAWCRQRVASDVLAGPALTQVAVDVLPHCRVLSPEISTPRAVVVVRLGKKQMMDGAADDPWRLEPRYVRRSAAEEKRAQAAEGASKSSG